MEKENIAYLGPKKKLGIFRKDQVEDPGR